uniref:RNA-dependent RNA polymerase n=1 Tax=Schizophyllum commune (strain H4-8 / FGSC 9210) TaxID=578458 RepID=D8QL20_SCHCM
MDAMDVPWGVQYELARGVLAGDWSWSDVTRERLLALRALSPDAPSLSNERHGPRVREALLATHGARAPKPARVAAFRELDLEQAALVEGKGRGLGLMGPWEEQGSAEDYFGGKIQQVVRLTREGKGEFSFSLLPMQAQKRSYRLARRLGSRRIVQVRLDKEYNNQAKDKGKGKGNEKEGEEEEGVGVAEFLAQSKFVLCGRVFVPYASKDGSAYLVEVDEDYERKARTGCGDQHRLSLEKLIESENPWVMNCNQPITKWVTRFSLSFSTSIPAVEFAEENMFLIEDEYATGWDRSSGAPPAEQTMTDGCGFINRAALTDIGRRFSLPYGMPTAVQGRVAGAKGMFLLHPYDKHPEPRVWIRDSQNKIKLPRLERWHRILDLLKFAQQPNPEGFDLSEQAVLNLSHNGVHTEDFTVLARNGLRERAAPLLNWTQPAGALWKAVSDIGNVTGSRRVRGSQVMHRLVSGYRQTGADEDLPTGDEDQMEAALTGRDPYSGAPRSVHEQVVELLQAGFKPQECEYLRIKMAKVLDMVCQSAVEDYRVPVPDSRGLNAFVVPDPLGVLNEDEIFYMPSPSFMDPKEQVMVQAVEGEVIVGRYPIRLPSDLRKVKAVNRPALHQYTNVILVPTVGERSLVSLLSGGDCDGDILFMLRGIFTKNFVNRPYSAPTPDFMSRNFEKERETIADFCGRVAQYGSHAERQAALARVFLAELGDSKVGIYSMYHDMAIAEHGYGAPETVRIAHMFNTLLDAKKTGVRVKPHILVEDMKRYKGEVQEHKKPHVLRALRSVARQTKGEVLSEFARMADCTSAAPDAALLEPRRRCLSVGCLADEVAVLDAHVQAIHAQWLNKLHGPEQAWKVPGHIEEDEAQKKRKKRRRKPGEAKEDDMLVVTRAFASVRNEAALGGGEGDNLQLLRATGALDAVLASCAYTARPLGYYAFTVAFGELCRVKARAVGDVACVRTVDEVKTIPSSALPYLMGEDEDDGW